MKASDSPSNPRRRSSTQHYHTFSTPPPKSRGRPPTIPSESSQDGSSMQNGSIDGSSSASTPLPKMQMAILAIIALAEQTALNSISPYLPDMTSTFPEVGDRNVGVYVGTIASAFALAQFVTNFFWGWLSDRVGRKPVILLGTAATAVCFVLFGFCRTLWQAILVQALMGMVNGNAGLVSTCLGEITNRSNQSRAFTYLPVLYGLGGITGPVLGGSLVFKDNPFKSGEPNPYPYLIPNVVSAAILVIDFIITSIWLEESLDDAETLPTVGERVKDLFSWIWQFTASHRPPYIRSHPSGPGYLQVPSDATADSDLDSASDTSGTADGHHQEELTRSQIFNRDTILLLATYLIFALVNVSFNSLYPIFAQAPEPVGRELTPQEIGLSLGFSGIVTIIFQVCIFGRLRDRMGNKWSYRTGLLGFVISFLLTPFVGYKGDDKKGKLSSSSIFLAIELCVVLLIKTVAAVGGLTSALLLVTNSAPNHHVLGALNGLAQTLSAAGRAVGPFVSGGLFSLASKFEDQKGEALPFGIFAAVSFVGFVLSFGIRSPNLEAQGWNSDDSDNENESDQDDDDDNASEGENANATANGQPASGASSPLLSTNGKNNSNKNNKSDEEAGRHSRKSNRRRRRRDSDQ